MMPHHQGAIDIARAELKYGHNEEVLRLVHDIIAEQENEMLVMRSTVGGANIRAQHGQAGNDLGASDKRAQQEGMNRSKRYMENSHILPCPTTSS